MPATADLSGVDVVRLAPQPPLAEYTAVLAQARDAAERRLGAAKVLS